MTDLWKKDTLDTLFVIGDDIENGDELLGVIESIEITDKREVLILDSRANKIKGFNAQGELFLEFGKTGHGPGELNHPESMLLTHDNRIIVIDRFNKIHSYQYENGSVTYLNTKGLDYVPVDMCAFPEELVIRGIRHSKKGFEKATILHLYSLKNLSHLKSFGKAYKSKNGLIINQLSDGPVACDINTGSIVTMFEYLPFIYSYDKKGTINWIAKMENFQGLNITENYDGSVTFSPNENGISETGIHITKITSDKMILQTRTEINESVYHKGYIFRIRDGIGSGIGKTLLFYDVNENYIVTSFNSDIPAFQLLKF